MGKVDMYNTVLKKQLRGFGAEFEVILLFETSVTFQSDQLVLAKFGSLLKCSS